MNHELDPQDESHRLAHQTSEEMEHQDMKTISLTEAHELLSEASAIIVNNDVLMYPSVSDLTGESDNEFLNLSWIDSEGLEFTVIAYEGDNKTVKVTPAGGLVFVDDQGDEFEVTLLQVTKVK
jgi:hypothetical protein